MSPTNNPNGREMVLFLTTKKELQNQSKNIMKNLNKNVKKKKKDKKMKETLQKIYLMDTSVQNRLAIVFFCYLWYNENVR